MSRRCLPGLPWLAAAHQLVHTASCDRALQAGPAQLVQAADNGLALAATVTQLCNIICCKALTCLTVSFGPAVQCSTKGHMQYNEGQGGLAGN